MATAKRKTEDQLSLDVRAVKRAGLMERGVNGWWAWFESGEPYDARFLSCDGEGVVLRPLEAILDESPGNRIPGQWLQFTWTPCHFGGERPWWQCTQCGRRMAIAYESDGWWACRRCLRLAYACQSERPPNRAHRQANKIRRRLGWKPGIAVSKGDRPKGMHRETYERMVARHDEHADIAHAELRVWLLRRLLQAGGRHSVTALA